MTAQQLLARPQNGCRSELIEGQLIEREFAEFWPGCVGSRLAIALATHARARNLGVAAMAGTGFEIATDTVLAPDVGFVAKNRLPADLSTLVGFFPGAPDLAVEVVSPSDTYSEVETKAARYLDAGTRLVWIVRPRQKRIEVHRADGTSQLLSQNESLSGESVVPGFSLPLARVFG